MEKNGLSFVGYGAESRGAERVNLDYRKLAADFQIFQQPTFLSLCSDAGLQAETGWFIA
jgi:hypothetical protein